MDVVRTRFAPSPTGYLHVGGVRTALFNYLYAHHTGGKFVLRIEDTDLERSTPEAIQVILEAMDWLGLKQDEGPFYQTDRFDRYNEVIDDMLEKGLAYRCDCSVERLDSLREEQMKQKIKPRYDGRCRDRHVSADQPHVVRFKNPTEGIVVVDDMVHGRVPFQNSELDDLIIRRTDGSPTYNFVVLIDDADMKITHVFRGDDHLNNTPRQINILKALGFPVPHYAHIPMILGDDGAKLSKRHGAVNVLGYRDAGYLPEALLNYMVRLGWSHGDQEIFTMDEMIEYFDIVDVNKAASAFNIEKLNWVNQQYLQAADPAKIAVALPPFLQKAGLDAEKGPDLTMLVKAMAPRVQNLVELAEASRWCFQDFAEYDENSAKKHLRPVARQPLEHMKAALEAISPADWQPSALHHAVEEVSKGLELNMGKVAQPLRVAVVGKAASPGIDDTLMLVGRDATLRRIDRALEYIHQREVANAE